MKVNYLQRLIKPEAITNINRTSTKQRIRGAAIKSKLLERSRVQKFFTFFAHTQTQRASASPGRTVNESKLLTKIDHA